MEKRVKGYDKIEQQYEINSRNISNNKENNDRPHTSSNLV